MIIYVAYCKPEAYDIKTVPEKETNPASISKRKVRFLDFAANKLYTNKAQSLWTKLPQIWQESSAVLQRKSVGRLPFSVFN